MFTGITVLVPVYQSKHPNSRPAWTPFTDITDLFDLRVAGCRHRQSLVICKITVCTLKRDSTLALVKRIPILNPIQGVSKRLGWLYIFGFYRNFLTKKTRVNFIDFGFIYSR